MQLACFFCLLSPSLVSQLTPPLAQCLTDFVCPQLVSHHLRSAQRHFLGVHVEDEWRGCDRQPLSRSCQAMDQQANRKVGRKTKQKLEHLSTRRNQSHAQHALKRNNLPRSRLSSALDSPAAQPAGVARLASCIPLRAETQLSQFYPSQFPCMNRVRAAGGRKEDARPPVYARQAGFETKNKDGKETHCFSAPLFLHSLSALLSSHSPFPCHVLSQAAALVTRSCVPFRRAFLNRLYHCSLSPPLVRSSSNRSNSRRHEQPQEG